MANSVTHAALPYPVKGARFTLGIPYFASTGTPTDPTTPDTERSIDGAAFADCTEEATTVSGTNTGSGYITLTGDELNASIVQLAAKAASGPNTTLALLYPKVLASVGTGTLSAGSAGGGTLGTLLSYDVTGCFVKTTGGTGGAGGSGSLGNQARKIVTYNTSSGAFTVEPNWETTPDPTTTYAVLLPEGVTLGMLRALNPTTAGRTLDVSAGGEAGLDWANVGTPGSTVNLSATTVNLVNTLTTYTGNTPQTGDSFARIGVTGAGLTTVPWNASWDAEVQSEVDDALIAKGLDHLVFTSVVGADIADNSIIARLASKSATADWDSFTNTTDSLEALGDASAPSANTIADALLDRAAGVETGLTPRQALKLITAATAGKASGLNGTTATYRNAVADSVSRIIATVDLYGNRSAITYDVS